MNRRSAVPILMVIGALVAACAEDSDGGPETDALADAGADSSPGDIGDGEADAVDAPDGTSQDIPDAVDAADVGEDTGADGCGALRATAEAELAQAGDGCDGPTSCRSFGHPICGTFGCFRGAVRKDADIAALEEASTDAREAGCSPFHCGCGVPEDAPVCLEGSCRLCPPDCGEDCEALGAAIEAFAAEAAKGCEDADDCALTQVDLCSLGPQIACHGLAHRADAAEVLHLLDGYGGAAGCPVDACDCQATEATCDDGVCVPVTGAGR